MSEDIQAWEFSDTLRVTDLRHRVRAAMEHFGEVELPAAI